MTVTLIIVAVAVAGLVAWQLSKKKTPYVVNTDAPLHVGSAADPEAAARMWLATNQPSFSCLTTIGKTGSMLPLLQGGEYAVLVDDWPGVKVGKIIAYAVQAGSSPPIGSRLVHRVFEMKDGAAIMKGDTPGQPVEDWDPVTKANYIGTLVAVFRQA